MKNKEPTYFAIIPAAGSGSRFGADIPKQYLSVAGKTVLEHSITALANFPGIQKIVVALAPKDEYWPHLKFPFSQKMLTVLGGETRAQSVLNALKKLGEFAKSEDWVLVHDAARPCLLASDIARLITEVAEHPVGGILGIPVRDTLKCVNAENEIIETLSRENKWCAQTPQMFRFGLLLKALQGNLEASNATDDSGFIEKLGLKPLMVLGGMHNLKITYPEDLIFAEREL